MLTPRNTALTIFLCSLASLAYEVTLTRIFSISLWYHYAFMVISIAMLGFVASGAAVSIFHSLKREQRIGPYALLLGIAIPLSHILANQASFDPVRLVWDSTELLSIGFLYAVLAIPFFCCGLVVVTAFSLESSRAGVLYGADLTGAALGSLGILFLLHLLPPERALFLLSLPPPAGSLAGWPTPARLCPCLRRTQPGTLRPSASVRQPAHLPLQGTLQRPALPGCRPPQELHQPLQSGGYLRESGGALRAGALPALAPRAPPPDRAGCGRGRYQRHHRHR